MDAQRLRDMAADPAVFQAALIIDAGGKRPFGDVMADFQRERFAAINPALLAVARGEKPAIGRFWWEATKGCSKDSDLAVCLLWLCAFCPRLLTIQVGAADQEQADELRKAAKTIVHNNAWLEAFVDIQTLAFLSRRQSGGPRVDIIAADAPGSHGARPDVLIVNELTHHRSQEFAATLLDNATKVPHGLVVIATNAGHTKSWQEEWRDIAIADPSRWSFHVWAEPAPWLDEREIQEAKKRNPAHRFDRLFKGIWGSDTGQGIPPDDVKAAIRTKLKPTRRPRPGWVYVAGIDAARSRDNVSLVVIGKQVGCTELIEKKRKRAPESRALAAMRDLNMMPPRDEYEETVVSVPATGKLRLAAVRVWTVPKGQRHELSKLQAAVLSIHERLGLSAVAYDPYEMTLLSELLERAGLNMVEVPFVGKNMVEMASAMLEEFADRNVELYEDERLLSDLRRMQIIEKSYGMRLNAKRSNTQGHADCGTAFTLAVLASREFSEPMGDVLIDADTQLIWQ